MWRLIIFLLFLIASVWLGLELVRHPGYLLLVYHSWLVQMPLWFAALCLILLLGVFYVLIASIDGIQFMWYRLKNWFLSRRKWRAYSKTQHGLTLLLEGYWRKAERLLIAGVNRSDEPLVNFLGAAKAAHEQGAYEKRDQYIQKAYRIAPHAELAIGLTQAELALSQDQLEEAQATLLRLNQLSPHHPRVLRLLEKVYVRLADWKALLVLLPSMRKAKVVTREQATQFEKNLYCEMLTSANEASLDELHARWNEIQRSVKKYPDVVLAYARQLTRFMEAANELEELIRKTLKQHYEPALVTIYADLPLQNLNRQLVIAGAWLKLYGQQPALLLLLGKLCVRVQLWGKAKDYFEKCLALSPNADAALQYGKLLSSLNEPEAAMQTYQDVLVRLTESEQIVQASSRR